MLLKQASKTNTEPSQAYKMGTLTKIVDGLQLILKLVCWEAYTRTLRFCLDTWISDTSDPNDLKTKESPFVFYLLITWITTH